ncbi:MAG: hypothetical protein ACI8PT_002841 [Gammaproteobacteria bacterium]|jgi:hypothetical protein
MHMLLTRPVAALTFTLLMCVGSVAQAADYEAFFGHYAGRGVANSAGALSERDLRVEIRPGDKGKGFLVAWSTVTRRADGTSRRKEYQVRFVPTQRTSVFSSAMRINMFGRAVPLDPLNGDPYVWAVISGRKMTVYAMLVTDDFGYEMQVYERTLTKEGLNLRFTSVRDGKPHRDVTAKLVRLPR